MEDLKIYTDGACNQKTGKGGWSFLIIKDEKIILEQSGSLLNTTNNKCEMIAAIQAINSLKEYKGLKARLFSDSAYVVNAFLDNWIEKWNNNNWINSEKKPVLNKELWLELIELQKSSCIEFVKIKRVSDSFSKRVDELAKKASNE
jgi:ribonuclease HI